jgi:hypothetical protein
MNAQELVAFNIQRQDRTGKDTPLKRAISMAEEITQLLIDIDHCTTLEEAKHLAHSRVEPTIDGILTIGCKP